MRQGGMGRRRGGLDSSGTSGDRVHVRVSRRQVRLRNLCRFPRPPRYPISTAYDRLPPRLPAHPQPSPARHKSHGGRPGAASHWPHATPASLSSTAPRERRCSRWKCARCPRATSQGNWRRRPKRSRCSPSSRPVVLPAIEPQPAPRRIHRAHLEVHQAGRDGPLPHNAFRQVAPGHRGQFRPDDPQAAPFGTGRHALHSRGQRPLRGHKPECQVRPGAAGARRSSAVREGGERRFEPAWCVYQGHDRTGLDPEFGRKGRSGVSGRSWPGHATGSVANVAPKGPGVHPI